MRDYIRDFIIESTGGRVAQKERTEKARENFFGGAFLGLVESLPSFILFFLALK